MNGLGIILGLAGGLGLFIFGMQMCSEGLQKMAANRLKKMVKVLTNHSLTGFLVGALATVGLQSSSATTALVVGFVSAGMMALSQALGVLLGSALGASLTAQLIAFKTSGLALLLLFIGACIYIFSKRSRRRSLGQTILGFGLIFYGMFVMSSAMAPIRDYPVVTQILIDLEQFPVLEFLAAVVFTAIIQSSPAFLGLLMTLAAHQLIAPTSLVPFVLGAHLGGTITGILSSLGATGQDAKRAAWANFCMKLVNGLIFLPFCIPLTNLAVWSSADPSRQIANTHTFFSIMMAVGFLPFTGPISRLMEKLIPNRQAGLDEAVFLDESLLELPELAIEQAKRQTLEMGRIVSEEMLERAIPAIRNGDEIMIDRIYEVEKTLDHLYKIISKYITGLGGNQLNDDLMQQSIQVLYVANDLEHIGDIMINIAKNARKINREDLGLSVDGLNEIEQLYQQASADFKLALKAFETMDVTLATSVIKEHPKMLRLEKTLRFNHFDRMQCGNPNTVATSSIHLDLLEAFFRIDSHAVAIAQVVMGFV
ncbi:MAG TPA: Na/Pi cotransporter family protein [Bacillota bacterium]|nr:Na/Pi cotransporter family protein [Bacillota bacterium]